MTVALAFMLAVSLFVAPLRDGSTAAADGETAFVEGRWDDAAQAFAEAYAHDPQPAYLYARAQAERKAGRCAVAIELYEQFLDGAPKGDAKTLARENVEACRAELPEEPDSSAIEPQPTVSPRPLVDESDDAPRVDEPVREPRPWYRDPWGGALFGVGAASAVGGGVLIGVAGRQHDRAHEASSDAAYGNRIDRAKLLNRAGIVAVSVGAALVVAGIVRWAVVGTRRSRAPRSVSVVPMGLGVTFGLASRRAAVTGHSGG
jgi:tetratricopeptide (TPR) repeat protein